MSKQLSNSVVVITGASSGIGKATALAFAQQGAILVLAARRDQALQDTVFECQHAGGTALAVPTDVTDANAVHALARKAVEQHGHIDTWINNAAVSLFSRFEDAPLDVYRKVIDTDLFGYIHGARAAIPIFRNQGHGTLINVASIVAKVPQPYSSAYVISMHGIRALGECLRQELMLDGIKDINVCTVMPATVDTPLFQNAANYLGKAAKAMPPVYPPEEVAQTIVQVAQHPEREVLVGNAARVLDLQQTVAPGLNEKMYARMTARSQFYEDVPSPPTQGNVMGASSALTGIHGGWMEGTTNKPQQRRYLYGAIAVAVAAVPAVLGVVLLKRQMQQRSTVRRLLPWMAAGLTSPGSLLAGLAALPALLKRLSRSTVRELTA